MSRCFPFPPPGYERKERQEDLEILKEEKRKEKKHKKEKKKKERKGGKEKKERDRSDDKCRVKKDRKEKHKDKKDKGKEKEKSSISEEATVAGILEVNNGEKLPTKGGHDNDFFVDEAKRAIQFQGQNGGRSKQNSWISQGIEESKFVQELDRRIRDDGKASGSQLLGRVSDTQKRDQDPAVRDSSGILAEDGGKNKDKRVNNKKMGVQGFSNEFIGNSIAQNLTGMAKSKVEGMPRPAEEQNDRILPSKETSKERGDSNRDGKQKDRDRDKKSHKIDKEKDREKKKVKTKRKSETKESTQVISKDVGRKEAGAVTSYKSPHMLEGINSSAVSEGNSRKRKDLDSNGFLHDSEVRHNKLQRLSHQLTENGRKLESARIHCISTLDKKEIPNNFMVDNKDMKVNDKIEVQKSISTKSKPSATSMFGDQIVEASKKSPHPDSKHVIGVPYESMMEDQIAEASNRPSHPDAKYLNEILMVPKMELPDVDDQEWLFTHKDPPSNSNVRSSAVNEELHVWSQAVHIESAVIYALPYVVPY
ncbi:unnamed protein product [Fraxinus pennsylvanica]|uniref:Uncharacterized protein n=1 Tax=Fraxinus pennsylvanica TaxID=56036 RepID=A0AAD1ZQ69_9LAMI|nr:unnamed protein product [Fraxinus pennsylvanica]